MRTEQIRAGVRVGEVVARIREFASMSGRTVEHAGCVPAPYVIRPMAWRLPLDIVLHAHSFVGSEDEDLDDCRERLILSDRTLFAEHHLTREETQKQSVRGAVLTRGHEEL